MDRNAIKIYEKHFPDRTNYGDIRKIKAGSLPDFDLFCGGFPCQDVSIAGKRKGLCGARSGLFFEIVRIIRKKQPRYILLENVKGLLSSNKGWDFARVLVELDDAGYSVEWAVLNSKYYGVPQNRERVFIVGHSGGEPGSKIFPLGEGHCHADEGGEQPERGLVSNAIDSSYYKGADGKRQLVMIGHTRDEKGRATYHEVDFSGALKSPSRNQCNYLVDREMKQITPAGTADAQRIYESSGIARTLKGTEGGLGGKTGLYLLSDSGLHRTKQIRDTFTAPLRANTGAAHNNIVNSVRRLTPLECERLQGYPDGWTEWGSDGLRISDTQRYKTLGNSVTVNVIEAIIAAMVEGGSGSWQTR